MVFEKRYNDIIDRMIAEERAEAMAFQKVVYPLVGLYVTSILVTAFKPKIFAGSPVVIQIFIFALATVSVIHLVGRIRDGLDRYTEIDDSIHESILDDQERKTKPYSRLAATATLLGGLLLCLGVGMLIGTQLFLPLVWNNLGFYPNPRIEFDPRFLECLFYPPIVAVIVDLMHTIASRFER
jgi:hypothetical protein